MDVVDEEMDKERPIVHWTMKQFWRVQQSQVIISAVFWATTLTLLIYERTAHRLVDSTPILGVKADYWLMGSLYFGVFAFVFFVGWFYDHVFSLWREQKTVEVERHPFNTYLLNMWALHLIGMVNEIRKDGQGGNEEVGKDTEFIDSWLEHMTESEVFRRMVLELDKRLDKPVPELTYLPSGSVQRTRRGEGNGEA